MARSKTRSLSVDSSPEHNVYVAKKRTGSYLGAAREIQHLVNVSDGHRKNKRHWKTAELLALHKKAKQLR